MSQNTIIAYQKDGASLTQLKDGGEGTLRLIIGNDEFAQRWLRGVAVIQARANPFYFLELFSPLNCKLFCCAEAFRTGNF
jgi:hypothetical protein